jgi:hypothetical protein
MMTQQEVSERRAALEKRWGHLMFDRWEQMAWFVALADTDLEACSEGDIQNWQDACEAIRMVPLSLSPAPVDRKRPGDPKQYSSSGGGTGSVSPTPDDVKNIRNAIAQPLKDLADGATGIDVGGQVTMSESFRIYRQKGDGPPFISSQTNVTGYGHYLWPKEFELRVRRLLKTFVHGIRRCPHCQHLFLQLRRNATYCGPACYSVAGMRRLREKERAEQQRAEKALTLKRKTRKKGVRP